MKKSLAALIGLVALIGCTSYGLNVAYLASAGPSTEAQPIFLKVKDLRPDKMVVTPAVHQKDLFKEVGSFVQLTAKSPTGKTTRLSEAAAEDVFYEAFRVRLEAMGFSLLPELEPGRPALVIEIEQFVLDLEGRYLKAKVAYLAKYSIGEKVKRKERLTGEQEEFYVMGKKTGEKILSEAFTSAVNRLDLSKMSQ
ncbi:MAG: hypothetical protein AB1896_03985 [Thermodesulfobacteriota bacterium]